jgi:hypothetical protein
LKLKNVLGSLLENVALVKSASLGNVAAERVISLGNVAAERVISLGNVAAENHPIYSIKCFRFYSLLNMAVLT